MSARHMLAAALLLAACGEEEQGALIPDFTTRSPLVTCTPLDGDTAALASVASVRSISDSTFLVADAEGRQIVFYDRHAKTIGRIPIPEEGPASADRLSDAAASGDSIIVFTDMGRGRVVAVTPGGAERWSIDAGFPTQAVTFAGDRLLVAAFGMDPRIPGLIHERRGTDLVPLRIPFISDPDALARMLVNSVNLQGFPDGTAIVMHELVWPRAWTVPTAGDAERHEVPIPEQLADRVGLVPTMPMRDEDLLNLLAPALSVAADPASGDLLYITRSGIDTGSWTEKAIVRVSSEFAYLGSVRLPVNAAELVYLPSVPDSVIVSDTNLEWHRCPIPARSTT